jgi:drug/metabolite transporter (DMT)-like permease
MRSSWRRIDSHKHRVNGSLLNHYWIHSMMVHSSGAAQHRQSKTSRRQIVFLTSEKDDKIDHQKHFIDILLSASLHLHLAAADTRSLSPLFNCFTRQTFSVPITLSLSCRTLLGKRWFVLFLWQVGSVLLCGLNVFNTLLANQNGQTLPFLQLALTYALILAVHIWRYERSDVSWLRYFIVSIFSGLGDALAIFAFNTTSLASAMLLTTTVVFWVAPLTFFILKRKISIVQLLAILVGFGGAVIVFITDGIGGSQWTGNALALGSALSYAVSNVMQELLVRTATVTLLLCRFTIFMVPVNIVLGAAIEWKAIAEYDWKPQIVGFVLGYAVLLAFYYSYVPAVLQYSSAMEMNISLLSSQFFSLIVSICAFKQKPDWLYLVGFFCVPIAIILSTLFPPKDLMTHKVSSGEILEPMLGNDAIRESEVIPQAGQSNNKD